MKKRFVSFLLALSMVLTFLPVGALSAFAADVPELGEGEFDYQGLRYKILNSTDVSVVGPVEAQTERVIPETVTNDGTTYTVTEIGAYAFSRDATKSKYTEFVGYPNFKSVTIPSTVTVLRTNAFAGGSDFNDYGTGKGLQSVTFASGSQLKTIEEGAFSGSYNLEGEITIPNTVETIGFDAFDGCQFEKFTFQEGSQLKSIGAHAFHWLGKVKEFSLPEGVTTIPHDAFWACTSLTEFVVPNGVQTIESKAFGHCYDLQSITIPSSVKSIASDIFEGDTKMSVVYYDGTESDWNTLSSGNTALENLTVYYARKVTFDMNGHEGTAPKAQKVYDGKTITKPADPKSSGYTFTDWYTDPDCSTPFDFTTSVSKDTTLYAGWKKIPDHELTVKGGTFTYDDNAAANKGSVYEGALVTITLDEDNQLWKDSGLSFDHWDIQSTVKLLDKNGEEVINPGKNFTFVMPKEGVTIEAMTKDATLEDDSSSILGTAAIIGTTIVGGAVLAYQGYTLGTEFWLNYHLPVWAVIPENRIQLAEVMWKDAGQPAPVSDARYSDIDKNDTEAQQAAQWAVENELMSLPDTDKPTEFAPDTVISRMEAIRTWKKYEQMKK